MEADYSYIELADAELISAARRHKKTCQKWVGDYDALGWWGKLTVDGGPYAEQYRRLATAPLEEHIKIVERYY